MNCILSIVYSGEWERTVEATRDGNVTPTGDNEVLDITHAAIYCSECGWLDDDEEYTFHRIRKDWQEE
jgi:hypothetical protein